MSITTARTGAALLASLIALAFAPAAFGAATITTFSGSEDVSFAVDDTCFGPGITATLTGTGTLYTQAVNTGVNPAGTATPLHLRGTETLDYRIDVSNGAYIIGALKAHFTFTEVGIGEIFINPFALHDLSTIYAADGTRLGTSQFHVAEQHLTFANGTVQVSFEKIHARCP